MDKNQTSQRAHAGVLSSNNRQPLGLRIGLVAILLALSLTSLPPTAYGQSCFDQCEQGYVACLRAALGEPGPLAMCDDAYDHCCEACD
jgi:hypothetical protein